MQKCICVVPVSAVRIEPSHRSEMTTQLLFGERCTISARDGDWANIRCRFDNYEGWCLGSHLLSIPDLPYNMTTYKYAKNFINTIVINDTVLVAPFGSDLSLFRKKKLSLRYTKLVSHTKTFKPLNKKPSKQQIRKLCYQFLNTPYLWGGKSVYGIDCSGFSQSVFRYLNIALPRDAWQQADQGTAVSSLKNSKCGDLCFFDNADGKITHVGILLNKRMIIHSSGKVRIDSISEEGIFNGDSGEQTHRLKMIKRFF
jgi:hypothetical protein